MIGTTRRMSCGSLSETEYYRVEHRGLRVFGALREGTRRPLPEDHNSQPKSYEGVSEMSRNPLKLDEEELQILGDFERGEFE
ncbi:MAG TPA: hypothetical protein VGX03_28585, partial [Candidatus Binatia bacterium]|nr:hypothetical protein [Candidatus Binatia bacterium]